VLLIWKWWDVRHKVNAGEMQQSCHEVAHVVAAMTSDLQKEEKGERDRNCINTRRCWSLPPPDWPKVNFDGAFCKESKFGSWGFIIRDYMGAPILAGAGCIGPVQDALRSEAVACLKALEAADLHGISRIILETDANQMDEAIRTTKRDLAPSGNLFRDIRELLYERFLCLHLVHVPRVCNSSAHELAKISRSRVPGQSYVWTDSLPVSVHDMVASDLAELRFIY